MASALTKGALAVATVAGAERVLALEATLAADDRALAAKLPSRWARLLLYGCLAASAVGGLVLFFGSQRRALRKLRSARGVLLLVGLYVALLGFQFASEEAAADAENLPVSASANVGAIE